MDKHSEKKEITSFFYYNFATDSFKLQLTRGHNSRVHFCPLYVRPLKVSHLQYISNIPVVVLTVHTESDPPSCMYPSQSLVDIYI